MFETNCTLQFPELKPSTNIRVVAIWWSNPDGTSELEYLDATAG